MRYRRTLRTIHFCWVQVKVRLTTDRGGRAAYRASAMTTDQSRHGMNPGKRLKNLSWKRRSRQPRKRVHVAYGTVWVLILTYCLVFNGSCNTSFASTTDEFPDTPFNYTHLWASQDGETHIQECQMHGFEMNIYSLVPQLLRSDFGGVPTKMVFTELAVGLTQGPHSPPAVQLVITIAGSWYVKPSDGSTVVLETGSTFFQDNVNGSLTYKVPQHSSGTFGDAPCHQFIVQFNRTAQIDNPCPFS